MSKRQIAALFVFCVAVFGVVSLGGTVRRAAAYAPSDGTFYVSPTGSDSNPGTESQPFQTIDKAREAVRSLIAGGMTSDVVVMLRGGRYYVTSPIVFDDQDSGRDGYKVVYTNYPGEQPIIIGGQKITGWTYDASYSGEDVYETHVGTGWTFNQLYEDGVPETIARTPNKGSYLTVPTVSTASDNSFPDGNQPSGAAGGSVYIWPGGAPGDLWNWFTNTDPITADSGGTVSLASPVMGGQSGVDITTGDRYYVQGFAGALDTPGEWYLDASAGELYYWPQHTPINAQEIVAPTETDVFELKGSSSTSQTQNITFDGLTFLGSDFTNNFDEFHSSDPLKWNEPAAENRHGIIYLENASHNTVQNCKIIGAGFNGVELNTYSDHNTISDNEIGQSGYYGVMLTGTDVGTVVSGAKVYDNHDNVIDNNYIHDSGRNVGNGGGIFIFQSGNNQIEHNVIDGAPRYGIGMKGMAYGDTMIGQTFGGIPVTWDNHWGFLTSRDNDIEYNDISNVNEDSQDSGIISLIGTGVGNIIANNRLHDVSRTWGISNGVYLDDNTDFVTLKDNLVYGLHGGSVAGYDVKGIYDAVDNNVFDGSSQGANGIESISLAPPPYLRNDSDEYSHNILYDVSQGFRFGTWSGYQLTTSDYNDVYVTPGLANDVNTAPEVVGCTSLPCNDVTSFSDWQTKASVYQPGLSNASYGTVAIDNTPSSTDKSLKFTDTDGTGNGVSVVRQFFPTGDDITYQFDVMASQTNGGFFADILDASGTSALSVGLSGIGTIRCWHAGGVGYSDAASYSANTWNTLKVVVHVSAQTYDVYINGSAASGCTAVPFTTTSVTEPDRLQFATGYGTGTYYVNNLSVSTPAEQFADDSFDGYTSGAFPTYDEHSITSDPLFTDPASRDYTLQPTSPALANGFVDLDYADMGLDSSYHLVRGVTATETSGGVVVSWDAVAGASSYVVRRTDDSGDSYTSVGTPSGTTYTDSTALSGKTYFYTVAAVVSGVEYPASVEVECDTTPVQSHIDDTFDAQTTGASPTGYTLSTAGGTVAIANVPGSGNQSMELVDTNSGSAGASATESFTSDKGVVTYEVRVMASQTTGGLSFDLYDGSGTAAATVAMSGMGTIRLFSTSGSYTDVQSYNASQWYTLRIVADVPNQVYDLYVDGSEVASQPFENSVTSLSQIDVATGYGTGTYDVDYLTVSGQALVNDPFDAETTGAAPAGYALSTSSGSVAIANTPGSGDKSMELVDTDPSGAGVSATKTFSDQVGTVTCEVKVRASQTTGGFYLELDDPSGTPAVQAAFSGGDTIRLFSGNGASYTDVLSPYASGTWYTLKIVANVAAQTYDFYVNGTAYATGKAFDNTANVIGGVQLSTGYSTGTYDVDYVNVTNT